MLCFVSIAIYYLVFSYWRRNSTPTIHNIELMKRVFKDAPPMILLVRLCLVLTLPIFLLGLAAYGTFLSFSNPLAIIEIYSSGPKALSGNFHGWVLGFFSFSIFLGNSLIIFLSSKTWFSIFKQSRLKNPKHSSQQESP